jgi:hypothetical protein
VSRPHFHKADSYFHSYFHRFCLPTGDETIDFIEFFSVGAGEGNRTLVSALGRPHSTIEPHPPGCGEFLAERKSQGNSKCKINMKTRDAASPKGGMNFGPETASGILDAAVMPA